MFCCLPACLLWLFRWPACTVHCAAAHCGSECTHAGLVCPASQAIGLEVVCRHGSVDSLVQHPAWHLPETRTAVPVQPMSMLQQRACTCSSWFRGQRRTRNALPLHDAAAPLPAVLPCSYRRCISLAGCNNLEQYPGHTSSRLAAGSTLSAQQVGLVELHIMCKAAHSWPLLSGAVLLCCVSLCCVQGACPAWRPPGCCWRWLSRNPEHPRSPGR